MLTRRRSFLSMAALGLASTRSYAQSRPPLLIQNAHLHPVSGPAIPRGSLLIEDGFITAIGESLTAPSGAQILPGDGLHVYPGLIDGLSTWGIEPAAPAGVPNQASRPVTISRGPEDRPLTTPWVKAADLVRNTDRRLAQARAAGFTTAATFPTSGIFAGQGALINLAGDRSGNMILDSAAGLYTTLATNGGGGFPASLMGTLAYLRQTYIDARHYRDALALAAKNPQLPRPAYERALEGILEAPRTLFPAVRAYEIDRMLRLLAEFPVKPVLYGLHEAFRRGPELAKAGYPALINLRWPEAPRDQDPEDEEDLRILELRDQAPSTPAVLAKAGVRFAFSTNGIESPAAALRAIRRSLSQGLSKDAALRALTLSPAEIYNVSSRLGSLDKGKIANLTVSRGDLFEESSRVQYVVIDGVRYEPAPEETPTRPEATR